MAGENNLLTRVIGLIRSYDDASWEALASKGLLRRARKDLEKGLAIQVVGEDAAGLEINVPPFQVSIPASGPAKASCTCPAPGVCQHILAAGLFLQARASVPAEQTPTTTAQSMREEMSQITADGLRKWSGTAEYRAGITLLEKNSLAPVIEYGDTVLVRLVPSGIEVRFVPKAGLEGMILPSAHTKRVAVAAVLALKKSLGLAVPEGGARANLVEITGAPRTPREILASAQSLLEDMVAVGLSHLSPTIADRLLTLSVSAQGANLPRVSLALRSLSDEIGAILERDARADESRLFASAARVYALMEAIRKSGATPSPELVGESRSQYVEVPEIELFGVGAYSWKTGSGYGGLTVLFWSNHTHEFLSWSDARPRNLQFDPRQRFAGEGPWDGARSPRQVAASRLKLRNARRTILGRISGSSKTTALVLGTTAPSALEFKDKAFTSWDLLYRYAQGKRPTGLRDPNPLELVVVLTPTAFGSRRFDAVTQTLFWDVYDEARRSLTLSLAYREWSKDAIRVLEQLDPPEGPRWQVVARIAVRDNEFGLEPVSILRPEIADGSVFHLYFDTLRLEQAATATTNSTATDDEALPEDETFDLLETTVPRGGQLQNMMTEFTRHLDAVAEAGCTAGLETRRRLLKQAQTEFYAAGLTCLARAVEMLTRPSSVPGRTLFQARFIAHLYSQASGCM